MLISKVFNCVKVALLPRTHWSPCCTLCKCWRKGRLLLSYCFYSSYLPVWWHCVRNKLQSFPLPQHLTGGTSRTLGLLTVSPRRPVNAVARCAVSTSNKVERMLEHTDFKTPGWGNAYVMFVLCLCQTRAVPFCLLLQVVTQTPTAAVAVSCICFWAVSTKKRIGL